MLLVGFLASCSPYERDFRRASREMPRPAVSPHGPWVGEWRSEVNGHHGPIWCLVDEADGEPDVTRFRYRAGWGLLQFGDFSHKVPTRRAGDGSLELDDEMELPGGFGTYRVQGRVTAERFDVTYRSRGDHGTMTLRRPNPR